MSFFQKYLITAVFYPLIFVNVVAGAVLPDADIAEQKLPLSKSIVINQTTGGSQLYGAKSVNDGKATVGFHRELDAVVAAVNHHNPLSIDEDREYLGAILVLNGAYFYTAHRGAAGRDQITMRIRMPKGAKIVAFWHTHGAAGMDRHYFSDKDVRLVKSWNKPFYLGDYTGQLKILRPGDKALSLSTKYWRSFSKKLGLIAGNLVMDDGGQLIQVRT